VTRAGLPLAGKPVALTLDNVSGARLYTRVAITDYAGRARWMVPAQIPGSYTLKAWFGLVISPDLDLTDPYYTGGYDTASLAFDSFGFSGFFSPVDNQPVYNKVKAGSAVAVKFSLGGDFGLAIFANSYPTVLSLSCPATAVTDPIEQTVSASANSLNYDPLTGQYIFVWKTDKKWAGGCRSLVLRFIDGTERTALFQFTR
jgi:hypothetical protein